MGGDGLQVVFSGKLDLQHTGTVSYTHLDVYKRQGISTSKLHAYGPMGVQELTTTKFVVFGQGQVRQ